MYSDLTQNISKVFARQVYSLVVSLITSVVIARTLGPGGSGTYSMALYVPMVLIGFFNMGIAPAAIYCVNAGWMTFSQARAISIFLWKLVSSTAVLGALALIFAIGNNMLPNIGKTLLIPAVAAVPLLLLNGIYIGFLQALEDFSAYNIVQAFGTTMQCILITVVVWFLHFGPGGALLSFLLSNAAATLLAYSLLKRHEIGNPKYNVQQLRKFVTYGAKSNVADSVQLINYRADLYFVNYYGNAANAGVYALAVALSEKLLLLIDAMRTVLFPQLAKRDHRIQFSLMGSSCAVAGVTAAGAIVLSIVAHGLVGPVFGSGVRSAARRPAQ